MLILSRKTSNFAGQRGVGMIEVLVAVLLLAVGVLGFSVLQVRAVQATGEALNRSQAVLILRGLADGIRVNLTQQASYPTAVAAYSAMTILPSAPTTKCFNSMCAPSDMVNWDAYQAALAAFNLGMNISMTTCPGDQTRQCLFASWGKTTLTNISPTTMPSPLTAAATDCMEMTAAGVATYVPLATCVMVEAY